MAQNALEELHAGTVVIDSEEYGVATGGVRKRQEPIEGRTVEFRSMTFRLRKQLHPTEPALGKVISFTDEDGVSTEWRMASLSGHGSDVAWTVRCYEPSDERG